MIELVLTYCLLANAASCVERRPVLEEAFTSKTCVLAAQQLGAKYVDEHRLYRFASWRCESAEHVKRAA